MPIGYRNPDPWKFGKGKGGGLTVDTSNLAFHNTGSSKVQCEQPEAEGPHQAGDDSWLFAGRRVRVHGLKVHPEMNDVKGTLVEEVQPHTWHVRLDDDFGDKLLKVENMMKVHTSAWKPVPKVV